MNAIRLQANDVTVIDLSGRMTRVEEALGLRSMLQPLLERGYKRIVLNFAEVNSVDSFGMGELVHAYHGARACEGEIKLAHVNERIQELLQITKLYAVFDVYDDEVEAVAAFGRDEDDEIRTAA
ncbi:MAG TPA: STAS domain-containing protein [Candidatus Saccharimonadales bacterium]|nr:STAS domain-containing protein [Candidatus Saccharimonadales bacterium]